MKKKSHAKEQTQDSTSEESVSGSCSSSPSDERQNKLYSSLEDAIGMDMDVLEMKLDDTLQQQTPEEYYSSEKYLHDCRARLIAKVEKYKIEVETLKSENIELQSKSRGDIEKMRLFYSNMFRSRGGRILLQSNLFK